VLLQLLNTAAIDDDVNLFSGLKKFDQLPAGLIIVLITPLTNLTKTFGVKKLIDNIFNWTNSEDSILLLFGITQRLGTLELYSELGELYMEISNRIDCTSDDSALLFIRALESDHKISRNFSELKDYVLKSKNENLLIAMGNLLIEREDYSDSMLYFEKCLQIRVASKEAIPGSPRQNLRMSSRYWPFHSLHLLP
jgi:hypothetical protein